MSTSLTTLIRLRAIQNTTRSLFENMNDLEYRLQFHPQLSPMGWHLGHGMFIENYWLHEVIQGDDRYTFDKSLFIPENCPKPERGPRLPPMEQLLHDIQQQQDQNALMLMEKIPPLSEHSLFKDEYIENFIIQHYAQHYETLLLISIQIQNKKDRGNYLPETVLEEIPPRKNVAHITAGEYKIGGQPPYSYDNELPARNIQQREYFIATRPVSNAEFLYFINQGGYQSRQFWCDEGWDWKLQNNITQPEHWKQNHKQQWYGINNDGPYSLPADEPVSGVNHYEASAYARFAGARLPHEHEWEIAACEEQLTQTAHCWEWCNNTFHGYPDFTAFPYKEYSTPWFDNNHYVLKGGSPYTRPEIKRAAFRNFYQPQQRHIMAGIRLVFETP